jgi:hypothetical protein
MPRTALVAAWAFALSTGASAEPLPGGAELGMSVPQLQQAVPGLGPVAHAAHMAGGLVGSWAGPAVQVAGVALTPTFFVAHGQLRRVEYLAASGTPPSAFDALVDWARSAWGAELASDSPEGAYATWSRGDTAIYVQRTSGARGTQLRLVFRQVAAKDDSEL